MCKCGGNCPTWKPRGLEPIPLCEMGNAHLINSLNILYKMYPDGSDPMQEAMHNEILRRLRESGRNV